MVPGNGKGGGQILTLKRIAGPGCGMIGGRSAVQAVLKCFGVFAVVVVAACKIALGTGTECGGKGSGKCCGAGKML